MVFEPIYGHSVSFRETGLLSLYILPLQICKSLESSQHIKSCSYIELGLPVDEHEALDCFNLVPRAFSSTVFKMSDRREKALAKAGSRGTKSPKNFGDCYQVTF